MPRMTSEYPEKFTMRVSVEQRINFITLAWFLGMEGKYGMSVRWFFNRFWNVFYAGLSDEERDKFEKQKELVIQNDQFETNLLV